MGAIKIKTIGCGDAFGSGGRLNTCFYVKSSTACLLIDCGATSLVGLKKYGIKTEQIDAILITHFHGDHYGGLPFLLLDAAVHNRKRKLTIISPPGGQERLHALLDLLYPSSNPLEKLDVDFVVYIAHQKLQTANFNVLAFPMVHTEAALPHGLRIEIDGKVISYSGDTSWTEMLMPLSDQADLFICECNFFSTEVKGHLTYRNLEKDLQKLNYKRLLLTHFDDEMINQQKHLNHEYALDGMEVLL